MTAPRVQLLSAVAAALRRAPAWLASLADHSILTPTVIAAPGATTLTAGGDYGIWWAGGAAGPSLAVSSGTLLPAYDADDGLARAVIRGASPGAILTVGTGPTIRLASAATAAARVIEIAGPSTQTEAPALILAVPQIAHTRAAAIAYDAQATLEAWHLGRGSAATSPAPTPADHRREDLAVVDRILADLLAQAEAGWIGWDLLGLATGEQVGVEPTRAHAHALLTAWTSQWEAIA